MKKALLIKYVSDQADSKEVEQVLEWASKDVRNAEYLARLQSVWVCSNIAEKMEPRDGFEKLRYSIGVKERKRRTMHKLLRTALSSAAVILILLLTGISGWYIGKNSAVESSYSIDRAVAEQIKFRKIKPAKEFYTNKGVKARLVLPDSSVVILNSDTKISYPEEFGDELRVVNLSGEAYFDVVKNPMKPMIVHTTRGFSVKVLGTKFNVKAYEDDSKAETTLYSGEIDLIRETEIGYKYTSVAPNQTVVVSGGVMSQEPFKKIEKESPKDDIAWVQGKIIFDETPVYEVVKILGRWHGCDFVIKDNSISNVKITATFNSESLVQIMDLIQMTSLVRYTIKDKVVYLSSK